MQEDFSYNETLETGESVIGSPYSLGEWNLLL